jgi:hypothetical protein
MMDDARLTAQAISDGLNSLHRCATILADQTGESPDPDSLDILDAMERAYETTRSGKVTTDMVITENHLAELRRARTLVQEWITTGQGSPELISLKDSIMKSLGYSEHRTGNTE